MRGGTVWGYIGVRWGGCGVWKHKNKKLSGLIRHRAMTSFWLLHGTTLPCNEIVPCSSNSLTVGGRRFLDIGLPLQLWEIVSICMAVHATLSVSLSVHNCQQLAPQLMRFLDLYTPYPMYQITPHLLYPMSRTAPPVMYPMYRTAPYVPYVPYLASYLRVICQGIQ